MENEIIIYQPDETIKLDVRFENETVWLTQAQMCELFQRERSVITKHINNVFSERECCENNNVQILRIADDCILYFFVNTKKYKISNLDDHKFKVCFCPAKTLSDQPPEFLPRYAKATEFFP